MELCSWFFAAAILFVIASKMFLPRSELEQLLYHAASRWICIAMKVFIKPFCHQGRSSFLNVSFPRSLCRRTSHPAAHCGQESVPGSTQTRHCIRHESFGEVSGKTFKVGHNCVEASLAISVRYDGFWFEAASAKQSVLNYESVHRQRLGWRSTHAQLRIFVGNHAGWIPDQCRCPNTVSDCSIIL